MSKKLWWSYDESRRADGNNISKMKKIFRQDTEQSAKKVKNKKKIIRASKFSVMISAEKRSVPW
jgi:hypothetical protein